VLPPKTYILLPSRQQLCSKRGYGCLSATIHGDRHVPSQERLRRLVELADDSCSATPLVLLSLLLAASSRSISDHHAGCTKQHSTALEHSSKLSYSQRKNAIAKSCFQTVHRWQRRWSPPLTQFLPVDIWKYTSSSSSVLTKSRIASVVSIFSRPCHACHFASSVAFHVLGFGSTHGPLDTCELSAWSSRSVSRLGCFAFRGQSL
jgi:hypothetical protein